MYLLLGKSKSLWFWNTCHSTLRLLSYVKKYLSINCEITFLCFLILRILFWHLKLVFCEGIHIFFYWQRGAWNKNKWVNIAPVWQAPLYGFNSNNVSMSPFLPFCPLRANGYKDFFLLLVTRCLNLPHWLS